MADEAVSKANVYAAMAPPVAVNASKAIIYAVLSPLVIPQLLVNAGGQILSASGSFLAT